MPDNPCTNCEEDCSSERCTHCPDNPYNSKPTSRVNVTFFPTVGFGRVAVNGSEDSCFAPINDRKKK